MTHTLIAGPYQTPKVRIGRTVLVDEVRGLDVVVGLTEARIPWPVGKPKGVRAKSMVVYGGLERAVRRESNHAVCHWWGVTPQTVTKWRKALGVPRDNEGSRRVWSIQSNGPIRTAARAKAHRKSRNARLDAPRRARISAATRGKDRSWETIRKMNAARRGTKHSAAARAKMSATHKRLKSHLRFGRREWTAAEDEAVRTLPAGKAAKACKRTLSGGVHAVVHLKGRG